MLNHLKIGTRLTLAFGGIGLVVLLLMAMVLSGIGGAEQALQGGAVGAQQVQAAQAHLGSVRAWAIGCTVWWCLCWRCWPWSVCARALWRR